MPTGSNAQEVLLYIPDAEYLEHGMILQQRYGFTLIDSGVGPVEREKPYLRYDREGLALINADNPKERVRVDFIRGRGGYRLSTMMHTAQPVLKAVGYNKERVRWRVLDATAGLGADAMLLAAAGCEVCLLERSAVMAGLLEDGLRRVELDSEAEELQKIIQERVVLHYADSLEFFHKVGAGEFEAIYLDPMFPERRKSSKVKKEMQLARFTTDSRDNAAELLAGALQTGVKRVVLKRPLKAPLLEKGVSAQVKGKSIRFDIYLR